MNNTFEIKKNGNKYQLLINDELESEWETEDQAIEDGERWEWVTGETLYTKERAAVLFDRKAYDALQTEATDTVKMPMIC